MPENYASRVILHTFVCVRKLEAVERLEPMSEDHAGRFGSCLGRASTLNTSDDAYAAEEVGSWGHVRPRTGGRWQWGSTTPGALGGELVWRERHLVWELSGRCGMAGSLVARIGHRGVAGCTSVNLRPSDLGNQASPASRASTIACARSRACSFWKMRVM